jgi:aromatic-L-amino-acid decarboxylase
MTLDPSDWKDLRAQGHRMLDDMFDYLGGIRECPVWQPMPQNVRNRFKTDLPQEPQPLDEIYKEFSRFILPYSSGNVHPGFMGWVQGGGTGVGMLAEMLAAGLNANLGGRDHAPIAVEQQIAQWLRQIFNFPAEATGLFVTGTSLANLIAVLVARTQAVGKNVRKAGMSSHSKLRAYTSVAAHSCITRAMDMAGLGSDALCLIPVDASHRMDTAVLKAAIVTDKQRGLEPFLVIGTAGTVDIGAFDDLAAINDICRAENIYFHVDGAYGALAMLSKELSSRLRGIEQADSIALDFHKWGQVPYDAGFILVRDGEKHRNAFSAPAAYLRRETRGLASGDFWPTDYGPDLSRGFRALKTWFTLKAYGSEQLGRMMEETCAVARHL